MPEEKESFFSKYREWIGATAWFFFVMGILFLIWASMSHQ